MVCEDFQLPDEYQLNLDGPLRNSNDRIKLDGISSKIVPFVSCGDLSSFDADKGESLDLVRNYCYKI